MFCPNCGTQNPETAATCSKCNFNLKGAAAPKFKGTMLMMNNPGAVPRPPTPAGLAPVPAAGNPPPAAGAPAPPPAPIPSKLKGTMVGVAPPMPPASPRAEPPPADAPGPHAAPGAAAQAPSFGTPAPAPSPFGGGTSVNPLGGTLAADANAFAPFGAQNAPPPGPGGPGFGQDFGAPPPQQAYGAPPPYAQGYGQPYGAQDPGPNMGGGGFPAPQQQHAPSQDWGPPQYSPQGMPGGMVPYGQQPGAMMHQHAPMQPGAHGPKGIVRNGMMVLVWSFVSCGAYQMWWFWQVCNEMRAYLGRDEPSFWKIFLLTNVTCGLYSFYWMITRCGALVQEIQARAGLPNPQNHGFMYLLPYYNVILLQEELNKAWQAPG